MVLLTNFDDSSDAIEVEILEASAASFVRYAVGLGVLFVLDCCNIADTTALICFPNVDTPLLPTTDTMVFKLTLPWASVGLITFVVYVMFVIGPDAGNDQDTLFTALETTAPDAE